MLQCSTLAPIFAAELQAFIVRNRKHIVQRSLCYGDVVTAKSILLLLNLALFSENCETPIWPKYQLKSSQAPVGYSVAGFFINSRAAI